MKVKAVKDHVVMLDIEGKLQVLDPDTTYDVNSEISKRLLQKMVEDDPEKK